MMWLDSSTVAPPSTASRTHSWNVCSMSGSRPDVGSSSTSSSAVGGQRGDQRHLLSVALGVVTCAFGRVQPETFDQLVPTARVQSPERPAEQVDALAARQPRPQGHLAGDVGEPGVEFDRVAPRVAAEHRRPPGVGAHEPEQDPDGGGLARPVGSEEPVDLAAAHVQVQLIQGPGAAEGLDQALDPHHALVF
jgi:hypothetical protein